MKMPQRTKLRLLSRRAVKQGLAMACDCGQDTAKLNASLATLQKQIALEIEPIRETERRIHSIFARCPKDKMTSQEYGNQQRKYGATYAVAPIGGTDASCELDETTSALVHAASHAHTEENIARPLGDNAFAGILSGNS